MKLASILATLGLFCAFTPQIRAQTQQVQVNAKIVSVPMDAAALRGAGLSLDSAESMSNLGIIPASQAAAMLAKLEKMPGHSLLSTPASVARSGMRSTIESTREFTFPSEYVPASLAAGDGKPVQLPSGQAITVQPATPKGYELRSLGFRMEFEPVMDAGSSSITLTLAPELVSFEGFMNYGSPIKAVAADKDGRLHEVVLTENRILKPVFSRVRAVTSAVIPSGHVLVLGQAGSGIRPATNAAPGQIHRPDVPAAQAVFFFIQAKIFTP